MNIKSMQSSTQKLPEEMQNTINEIMNGINSGETVVFCGDPILGTDHHDTQKLEINLCIARSKLNE
jgi:hypothetical protein